MPKPPHSESTLYGRYVGKSRRERRREFIRVALLVFAAACLLYAAFAIAVIIAAQPTPASPRIPAPSPAVLNVPTTYGPAAHG